MTKQKATNTIKTATPRPDLDTLLDTLSLDEAETWLGEASTAEALDLAAVLKKAAWAPHAQQHAEEVWKLAIETAAPDDRLKALMAEAEAAGDRCMAEMCDRALDGDYLARRVAAEALADAEAMS